MKDRTRSQLAIGLRNRLAGGLICCASLLLAACPAGLSPSSRPDTSGGGSDLSQQDVYVPASTYDTKSWLPDDGNVPQFDGKGGGKDGTPASDGGTSDADGQLAQGDGPQPADATVDSPPPDATVDQPVPVGAWVQANQQSCPQFCATLGKTNVAAPDGPHCMSGERRPASGIAAGIVFSYGCWPNCAAQGNFTATSNGKYCYSPGQKTDNDGTDRTVGCFCL